MDFRYKWVSTSEEA